MTRRRLVLFAAFWLTAACRSPAPAAPAPEPSATAAPRPLDPLAAPPSPDFLHAGTVTGSTPSLDFDHDRSHPPACPDEDFATHEHCVWLAPAGKTTAAELAKRMTDAGFPAEPAEGERVIVWWTPGEIEAFFGRKPKYTLTGGGSGGLVCVARVPEDGRPPAAVRGLIEGWIVDDPVCEL